MGSQVLLRLTLRRDSAAAAAARRALEKVSLPGSRDDHRTTALLASELINNAVLHGRGKEIRVEVRKARGRLRVEVADAGGGFDPRDRVEREDPGGWGLGIVGAMADEWGIDERNTHVWFELSV